MNASTQRRLDELTPLVHGDSSLDALAVAIAVEDSLGVVLSDEDLVPERLCAPAALRATVLRYLESG